MSQLYRSRFAKVVLPGLTILGIFVGAFFWFSGHKLPEDQAQNYYERGVKLAEHRDYAKASIELRNALRLKSNLLPAWRSLAQIEEVTQRWDDLIRSLQSIVSLAPSDVESRIKLAKLLVLGGNVYQALELTNIDEGTDSPNAEILGLKAAILYKLNDKLGAVRQAERTLAVAPANADALVVLANERIASGDLKGALQIFEKDTTRNVTDIGIQLLKLKIFEQMEDSQQVESLLHQLIESYPKESVFRKHLIKFYIDQHRPDDAEKVARTLVQENPTDPQAELDLVRLLYAAKGPAAAKQELVARINSGGDVFPYQIALVDFDLSEGNFTSADQRIRGLLNQSNSNEQTLAAQVKLAEMELRIGKIDSADVIVSEILRRDSRNAKALKIRASVRIARGQLELAISDLQQALSNQPRSTELILLLALAYERSGSMALAEKQYSDAVRISSYDATVGLNYVSFLLRRGSVDRAERFLTELSKRSPKNLEILSKLAQVELAREDWTSAREISEAIRNSGASSAHGVADQVLGAALFGQRKYDEGIAIFQSSVDASPSAVQPMIALVQALTVAHKTDKAIAFLKSTLESNPDNAEAQVLMGSIQLATGARDQALECFKLAIEKQPRNIAGYQALASLYAGEKDFDKALMVFRSGLQMQPDSVALHLAMAGALEQAHQYEAAISEYEQILSKQPGSMFVANNLASLLSDHRNDKASLERAQALAASLRETQTPQFKDTLGWVSYRRADYTNAIPLLEKAVTGLPDVALVRYHLAMAYIAIKQTAKASEQLTVALSLAPGPELEQKIKEALQVIAALAEQ